MTRRVFACQAIFVVKLANDLSSASPLQTAWTAFAHTEVQAGGYTFVYDCNGNMVQWTVDRQHQRHGEVLLCQWPAGVWE